MPLSLERYSVTLGKTWSLVFRKLRVEYANKPLVFPKLGEISPPPPYRSFLAASKMSSLPVKGSKSYNICLELSPTPPLPPRLG